MKKYLFLLVFFIHAGCSKKTNITDNINSSHQFKHITDTTVSKKLLITDKTITVINRSIDTNITISWKPLNGVLLPSKLYRDTSAHFENDDLSLFLYIDKTGKTTATAIPKSKTIPVKMHEHVTTYNNVVKKGEENINSQTSMEIKSNLISTHAKKETSGNATFSFSMIMILILVVIIIVIIKNNSFLGRIF